jgi:hypothetical protein
LIPGQKNYPFADVLDLVAKIGAILSGQPLNELVQVSFVNRAITIEIFKFTIYIFSTAIFVTGD